MLLASRLEHVPERAKVQKLKILLKNRLEVK
jgi:hypothetical protein